jgi:hypothetical protein
MRKLRLWWSRNVGFWVPPVGVWEPASYYNVMRRLRADGSYEYRKMTDDEYCDWISGEAW